MGCPFCGNVDARSRGGLKTGFKAESWVADKRFHAEAYHGGGSMTGRHRVCKRLALLGLLLPLAPGPGLAGEKEAAEAASCEAPAAVEQIRGLAGIVDRAVGVEARRAGASEPATTVVLNGRGYNYGPARETPPPGR